MFFGGPALFGSPALFVAQRFSGARRFGGPALFSGPALLGGPSLFYSPRFLGGLAFLGPTLLEPSRFFGTRAFWGPALSGAQRFLERKCKKEIPQSESDMVNTALAAIMTKLTINDNFIYYSARDVFVSSSITFSREEIMNRAYRNNELETILSKGIQYWLF